MKCLNPRCSCHVEEGVPYCCDECARSREEHQERCPCGHEQCVAHD